MIEEKSGKTDQYNLLLSEIKKVSGTDRLSQENQIAEFFIPEKYEKGAFFITEGEIPGKLGFITNGLMKYYYIDNNGHEWIKHFSAEKSFVSSYGSFLFQSPSLYFIEAVEVTSMLTISYNKFSKYIDNSLEWCVIARKYTEKIYYEKEVRESSFLKMNGTERYLDFLDKYKFLVNRVSIKEMASFLGLNHVSLSRIRSNIRN